KKKAAEKQRPFYFTTKMNELAGRFCFKRTYHFVEFIGEFFQFIHLFFLLAARQASTANIGLDALHIGFNFIICLHHLSSYYGGNVRNLWFCIWFGASRRQGR